MSSTMQWQAFRPAGYSPKGLDRNVWATFLGKERYQILY